jgi:hypothetical protein
MTGESRERWAAVSHGDWGGGLTAARGAPGLVGGLVHPSLRPGLGGCPQRICPFANLSQMGWALLGRRDQIAKTFAN